MNIIVLLGNESYKNEKSFSRFGEFYYKKEYLHINISFI